MQKKTIEEMLNRIKNFSAGHFQGCSSYVNLACDCPFGLSREALAVISNQHLDGVAEIAIERKKQQEIWSDSHDDTHVNQEIARLANAELAIYLNAFEFNSLGNLITAGALIAAEIDRMNRKQRNKQGERDD